MCGVQHDSTQLDLKKSVIWYAQADAVIKADDFYIGPEEYCDVSPDFVHVYETIPLWDNVLFSIDGA